MNARPSFTSVPESSAYAQFLEQLSNEEFWRLAMAVSHTTPETPVPAEDYLECVLAHARCLFPLVALREIVSPPHSFSRFPATPSWMIGIGAWHGETIAVVDLDAYLFQHNARTPQQCKTDGILVVAQLGDLLLGLLVTDVGSVTTLDVEQVAPFEQISTWFAHLQAEAVVGVKCDGTGNRQQDSDALLLDIPVLVNDIVQHLKNDRFL